MMANVRRRATSRSRSGGKAVAVIGLGAQRGRVPRQENKRRRPEGGRRVTMKLYQPHRTMAASGAPEGLNPAG
jgi:hypothetical protein